MHSRTHARSSTQWYTCTVVHTVVHMHSRPHSGTHAQSYTCTVVHTVVYMHKCCRVCVCVCQVGCVGAIRTSCLCPRTIYAQVFYTGKGGMHKLHACQTSTLVLDIYLCVHHHHWYHHHVTEDAYMRLFWLISFELRVLHELSKKSIKKVGACFSIKDGQTNLIPQKKPFSHVCYM